MHKLNDFFYLNNINIFEVSGRFLKIEHILDSAYGLNNLIYKFITDKNEAIDIKDTLLHKLIKDGSLVKLKEGDVKYVEALLLF